MNVIFLLIAVSLLVAIGFLVSFIWSIKAGQYDDEYTPSVRILFDDETNVIEEAEIKNSKSPARTTEVVQSGGQAPNTKQKTNSKSKITT